MKEKEIKRLTDMVADFVGHIGKKLPDDVVAKLEELGSKEDAALPKVLYETMTKNQGLAVELDRPSWQDTGVLQFWLKCGTNFPYINELEALLTDAQHLPHHIATILYRRLTSTTQRKMSEKEHRRYGGILSQITTSVRFMLTWQVADVLFRVKQWY